MVGGLGNQLFILDYALSVRGSKLIFLWNPKTCRLEGKTPAIFTLLGSIEQKIIFQKVESEFQLMVLNKMLGISERKLAHQKCKFIYRVIFDLLRKLILFFLVKELKSQIKQVQIEVGYFQDRKIANSNPIASLFSKQRGSEIVSTYKRRAEKEVPLIVHVRLGDYLQIPSMNQLNKEYFHEAIELIWDPERYKRIWIFSDSSLDKSDYVPSKLISLCDSINDENFSAVDLLEVMTLGSGYVISNSTLSWWAARLSPNGHSRVVAPHPWFSGYRNRENLYSENWIKINRKG